MKEHRPRHFLPDVSRKPPHGGPALPTAAWWGTRLGEPRGAGSPASTSVTLQSLEALERDPSGAGDELQEPGPPLLVEGLHGLPEPPHDVAVGHAVFQPSVGLPVAHVDFIQAADDQL